MAAEQATFVILPALLMGGIIGLIELFFVHADEVGMGWFMHGLHALPFTILFTFANMNVSWVLGFLPGHITETIWVDIIVRLAISVLGMLKVAGAAAIAGRVGERFYHTIVIGVLIFASAYIWMFIGPFIPLPSFF